MFEDSQQNQQDDQQTGIGTNPSDNSGQGSGAISYPTDDQQQTNDQSNDEPTLVHPTNPAPQDEPAEDNQDQPSDNSNADEPAASDTSSSADINDLSTIKKQALEELSPLVHKLDQSPEDKYKTLMMMIQASDNQSLLKEAYDTAQKITDEKVKAEALLNIVNEINYFTQNS